LVRLTFLQLPVILIRRGQEDLKGQTAQLGRASSFGKFLSFG
jgi:hypothetical protein